MSTAIADLEALGRRLPPGFRARPFEERDREPLVEARNREAHPLQQQSATEWREWERLFPTPDQLRVVVEDGTGVPVGFASLATGGPFPQPDGAASCAVGVAPQARGRGIGSALLELLEAEARRRGAPRLLGGATATQPFAIEWAKRRGYVEIGRRIGAAVDLPRFDAAPFADSVARTRAGAIRFATLSELLAERDEAARDALYHEIYAVDERCWNDIPMASRAEHPSYEHWRRGFEHPQFAADLTVLALAGQRVVGMTVNGLRGARDGNTWFTGTLPEYRGRGIALAMKVEALARARQRGLRAMLTTNDEPNAAMRGVNAKLGYKLLPAAVELEKRIA